MWALGGAGCSVDPTLIFSTVEQAYLGISFLKFRIAMKNFNTDQLSVFTGIDISKNKIDFTVLQGTAILVQGMVANNENGFEKMLSAIQEKGVIFSQNLFCMEATGIYSYPLLHFLKEKNALLSVAHPTKIKNASGIVRNKSDKLDAHRIADYAQRYCDTLLPWVPKRTAVSQLQHMISIRTRLVTMHASMKATLKEQQEFFSEEVLKTQNRMNERVRKALENELKHVEKKISKFVKSDKNLHELFDIMTSIPGIGPVTALEILNITNEFKNITCPKKFACYAGVAPLIKESGTKKSTPRISRQSDLRLKSLLTTCAFTAIVHVPDLKAYYRRKTVDEKKPKMLVINAIRFKLILRIFCCVKNRRKFNLDYRSSLAKAV